MQRRTFLQYGSLTGAAGLLTAIPAAASDIDVNDINYIGPKPGYTPLIGTLISQLDWLTDTVFKYHSKLSAADLDFVFDENSNSIGSLIMHLAATEVIYQDLTFFNEKEGFSAKNKDRWQTAMDLGKDAQEKIKGHDLAYYKAQWDEVRALTKAEMKKRNDEWLLSDGDPTWGWNNFCSWFHVAEHIANHRGQMAWYAKRLPGAKKGGSNG